MANKEYPDIPFRAPRAFGRGRDGHAVQYLVVHHTAGSERATSAEDGAAYDARRTDGTSTHYFVDQNSIVQCVYTWDRANAAHHYGNRRGIQYELCGTLQTRAQWLDAASDATLWIAARQMARDCKRYGIPARKIGPAEMRAGHRGICGHWDVTLAYGLGDHTDPGPWFPYDVLIARVQHLLNPATLSTPSTGRNRTMEYLWVIVRDNKPTWAVERPHLRATDPKMGWEEFGDEELAKRSAKLNAYSNEFLSEAQWAERKAAYATS
jgi:hypothetical protein